METINFTRGVPANESFPTAELIDASTAVFKSHGNQMLQYGPSRGFEPLRQWLAEWQRVDVDRVMTANGSLQLIEFLCLHMIKPGDLVFTESPSYDRTLGLLRRHGARVVGIEMEPDGRTSMRREREEGCAEVLLPDSRFPESGRRDLFGSSAGRSSSWRTDNLLLVEDALPDAALSRTEEPTLYELAPERTLHMSSFTKLIAPVFAAASCWRPDDSRQACRAAEDTTSRPARGRRRSPGSGAARPAAAADRALKKPYAPRLMRACRHRELHA
jgi:2-aminoadipate transaminase